LSALKYLTSAPPGATPALGSFLPCALTFVVTARVTMIVVQIAARRMDVFHGVDHDGAGYPRRTISKLAEICDMILIKTGAA